jgi:predicted dehydrogenase/threonine dehydrogenase-like Zn-dependent dehydrogenase
MKQIVQELRTGKVQLIDVPCPMPRPAHVVVRSHVSLISVGTERAAIADGKQSLLARARRQPNKVVDLLKRVRREGIIRTADAVRTMVERLQPLGYCNVGTIEQVGDGVAGLLIGDRVVNNGPHAERVLVPALLCAKVPDSVPDDMAAFTVLGAIALQAVRLASPSLGERFAVFGLGLVGLLAVQILRAHGVRVLAIDRISERLAIAQGFGADVVSPETDPVTAASWLAADGLDGVLLATATDSAEPMRQAAQMCRKRGRIVLVGVAGLKLRRADFYEKELTFQVSASYGPGRYEPGYEQAGSDYPADLVRWTAGRNFEAVLDALAAGQLRVAPLISARVGLDKASEIYSMLGKPNSTLGVLFSYPAVLPPTRLVAVLRRKTPPSRPLLRVALLGAGAYARSVLAPALIACRAEIRTVVTRSGLDAVALARRFGAGNAASDIAEVLNDESVDAVIIATPHYNHAALVIAALDAGKHVFVEKPLALSFLELDAVEAACRNRPDRIVMVGFNRRFSPLTRELRRHLDAIDGPKSLQLTVNAGRVPQGHWIADPSVSGGRIVGEGCHFVDLALHLAGDRVPLSAATALARGADRLSALLRFADGSTALLHYLDNGSSDLPKERIEAFAAGQTFCLNDFRRLEAHGVPGFKPIVLRAVEKGNDACIAAFCEAARSGGPAPVPLAQLVASSRATLELAVAAD